MISSVAERWILWSGVGVVLGAGAMSLRHPAWGLTGDPAARPPLPQPPRAASDGIPVVETVAVSWRPPVIASEWTSDLFTPPPIVRDPATGAFVLRTPRPSVVETAESLDLELTAVEESPFRVQLIGFVGPPENGSGLFAEAPSGATRLGRSGDVWSDLELAVLAVEVVRQVQETASGTAVSQWEAQAKLTDQRTGECIVLSSRERRRAAPDRVRLRSRASAHEWEQFLGTDVTVDGTVLRLVAICREPLEAEIAEERADGSTRLHRLRLVAQ